MLLSQFFPFAALMHASSSNTSMSASLNDNIFNFLIIGFVLWFAINIAFFCSIDSNYFMTFFGTKTAAQYTCELFLTSEADSAKFRSVFHNRISYSKAVHEEVRVWVTANILRWKTEGED